ILIHQGCSFFEDAEGADELGRHGVLADGEVDQRASGRCSVVTVGGDFDLAHGVGFGARWRRGGLDRFRHGWLPKWWRRENITQSAFARVAQGVTSGERGRRIAVNPPACPSQEFHSKENSPWPLVPGVADTEEEAGVVAGVVVTEAGGGVMDQVETKIDGASRPHEPMNAAAELRREVDA